jgi:DNA-binding response OmpR family regulator
MVATGTNGTGTGLKVLLAHADSRVGAQIALALRTAGHEMVLAYDGTSALQQWATSRLDGLLVQLRLPGLDGSAVCRRVRQEALTPVLLLGNDGDVAEEEVVRGLDSGADDFVAEPTRTWQLLARIRAVLRRTRPGPGPEQTSELRIGDLVLNAATYTVTRGTNSLSLTRTEYRIFEILVANKGRVVPYTTLIAYAWGYMEGGASSLLKSHVYHLRKKLGLTARPEDGLSSVAGVGYRLADAPKLVHLPAAA